MARPRKEPDYDPEKLKKELLAAIKEAYEHPLLIDADGNGHMKLNRLAEEFFITPLKARKLLITAGVYTTPICQQVQELRDKGKTMGEIQQLTGLSRASVHGYLPYSKVIYNMEHLSLQTRRLHVYRERKAAVEKLHMAIYSDKQGREAALWAAVLSFAEYPFRKENGERFRYVVHQDCLHFEENHSFIPRASLNSALSDLLEDGQDQNRFHQVLMKNPEKAEYLIPIFSRFGLLPPEENSPVQKGNDLENRSASTAGTVSKGIGE